MPYLICDRNKNIYTNLPNNQATIYHSLPDAFKALEKLPTSYFVRDMETKKKVEPK